MTRQVQTEWERLTLGEIKDGQVVKRKGDMLVGADVVGTAGPKGDPGLKGDKGDPGDAGPQGETGPAGQNGAQGQQGQQGVKGDKGDAGNQGIQGPAGPNLTTSAFGYTTGAGGTVTQLTNKSTGVTLNTLSGRITTTNAAMAAAAEATFVVTNNQVASTDVPVVAIASGGTAGSYAIVVSAVGSGSFSISLTNLSAGSLSQALVINFVIIKGASS